VPPSPDQPNAFSKLAEELVSDLRRLPYDEPPRSFKRATVSLSTVLEQLLVKHQIGRSSPEDAIREQWTTLVGPANAAHSHAVRIDRSRLLVIAAHSVVRNELFHHREEIVRRIRALPGCEGVKSLNIRAG
jgi:hypothetical protein